MQTSTPQSNSPPPQTQSSCARYESLWERLPDVLKRVMAATGLSKDDAQIDICRAIADGAIGFRAQLKQHATRPMTSTSVLERNAFEVPVVIEPTDLDWDASRPLKAWVVSRTAYKLHGYWYLAWIELRADEVTKVLCRSTAPSQLAHSALAEPPAAETDQPVGAMLIVASREKGKAVPARRRGPRAKKLNATMEAMEEDIRQGRTTITVLESMLEKQLAERYHVSRDTARKARNSVLSEFEALNLRQTRAIDK